MEQPANPVRGWLEGISLGHLFPLFEKEGFDDLGVVQSLTENDLQDLEL